MFGVDAYQLPLLAADWEAIIKIAFLVIFVFGSALAKLASTMFQQAGQAKGNRPAGDHPGGQDMGDLLRRLGMDLEQARPQRQGEVAEAELVEAEAVPMRGEVHADLAPAPPARPGDPLLPPATRPGRLDPTGRRVIAGQQRGASVRPRPDAVPALDAESDGFADVIEQADDRMAAHLRDVFQPRFGRLKQGEQVSAASRLRLAESQSPAPSAAAERGNATVEQIREVLQNPQGIRDALILAEILKRPSF